MILNASDMEIYSLTSGQFSLAIVHVVVVTFISLNERKNTACSEMKNIDCYRNNQTKMMKNDLDCC